MPFSFKPSVVIENMCSENCGGGLAGVPLMEKAAGLDFLPPRPRDLGIGIGLIGTGGIAEFHLRAYREMGLNVVALCDVRPEQADAKRLKYFPQATVYSDHRDLLEREDIGVVDITTHPEIRAVLIEDALNSGKHVLSQKPFVLDLEVGRHLIQLAVGRGLKLAVNQNARWAPHFRYMTRLVEAGFLGPVNTIDACMQWDHTWVAGKEAYERIHHLVLYDFAIHWFDIVSRIMGPRAPERIFASARGFAAQKYGPPALAHAVIDYADAQVRLLFNAHTSSGVENTTTIACSDGLIRSRGTGLTDQVVDIYCPDGNYSPDLQGDWFRNGFQGTMGELLCSIEQDREPENGALDNLKTLELTFAAIESADTGKPVELSGRGVLK